MAGVRPSLPRTNGRATLASVLGGMSLSPLGLLTGLPAVVIGVWSKHEIDRAHGRLDGSARATFGVVAGACGALLNIALFAGVVAFLHRPDTTAPDDAPVAVAVAREPAPGGRPANLPAHTATIRSRGSLEVVDIDGSDDRTLRAQLGELADKATASRRKMLVMTTTPLCTPCKEFEASLGNIEMQEALAGVMLVQIDADEFGPELGPFRFDTGSVPWFFTVDSRMRAKDAISAAEWDANVPGNMAPVLSAFVKGTYDKRRYPSPLGIHL